MSNSVVFSMKLLSQRVFGSLRRPPKKTISIEFHPTHRLGNRMFMYLFALMLQTHVRDAVIVGEEGLPEWSIRLRKPRPAPDRPRERIVVRLHREDVPAIVERMSAARRINVRIVSLSCRTEYYRDYLRLARKTFPPRRAPRGFGKEYIVFNVRGGDIFTAKHVNYTLVPIAFYEHLVAETRLNPVFVGEIDGDDDYSLALRRRFPMAQFIHSKEPIDDFNVIRTSVNIVPSVSTFSWLAAWLSESAERIILPILGFYHPVDRPDQDLLPWDDPRYEFWLFPSERWEARAEQLLEKISGPPNFRSVNASGQITATADA